MPVLVIVLVVGLPLVIVVPVLGVEAVDPVVGAVAVVPVEAVVVEPAGPHDSDTLAADTDGGSDKDDSGVPAGTSNDICPPPAVVTVTVQVSAEATGTAEIAAHVTSAPAVAKAT